MNPDIMRERSAAKTAILQYTPFQDAALVRADCDPHLVFLHEPHCPAAEQYRRIISRLVSRHPMGGTLMVTSPAPEDGKTLSAMNLAFCLAERAPVLLVDLDTRRSSVRQRFGLGPVSPSIEDALLELTAPEECVMAVPGTRLCMSLNRGDSHPVIDLMDAGRPQRFLEWALRKFMWVVFDTPPAFPIADTLEIAQHTNLGMLVVRCRRTPERLVKQAMDALKGHLHFVVFNDAEAPSYSVYNRRYYSGTEEDMRRWK